MGLHGQLRSALLGGGCLALLLAGCTARTNVGATGAAPADVVQLRVTVQEVGFATAADTPADAVTGWSRARLPSPVVLDLARIDAGALVPLVSGLSLPAGRYRQLQLVVADPGDRLVEEARAAGLQYNAQVDLRDAAGSISSAPLELPVPGAGLTIPVDLEFEDAGTANDDGGAAVDLAVTIDAGRDVLAYEYGDATGYVLNPDVSVVYAAEAGAIRGRVDAGALGADHAPVVVSAQVVDGSGTHRVAVQRRLVAADGTFYLHPLPAGEEGTSYDVVVSCAGANTLVIRGVPVTPGAAPTTLQDAPLALVPASSVHADVDGAATGLPGGTRVEFFQTLPGRGERPFLVDGTALDPLTRGLPGGAFALSAGPLLVGDHAEGRPVALAAATPLERAGGYLVGSAGPHRADTLGTAPAMLSGSSTRPTLVTVPYPGFAAGGRAGRLALDVQVPVGRYDRGFLTVMSGHRLVETVPIDELLERGGGTVFVDGLPSGSALAPVAGISYRAGLRAWNSRNATGTIQRVASSASTALGDQVGGVLQLRIR